MLARQHFWCAPGQHKEKTHRKLLKGYRAMRKFYLQLTHFSKDRDEEKLVYVVGN